MEISRWCEPPVWRNEATRPGGAVEIREVNPSAAPSGAGCLSGKTGGLRHRLISYGPPGLKLPAAAIVFPKTL